MRLPLVLALVLATGCDGYVDGGDDDDAPPSTDVRVTVKDGQMPLAGAVVIFQSADDTLIAELVTDTSGSVITPMPLGGNVTVIRTYPGGIRPAELYTYLGVKGGDDLQITSASGLVGAPVNVRVVVPNEAQNPVTIRTRCGEVTGDGPVLEVPLSGCGPTTDYYLMDNGGATLLQKGPTTGIVDFSMQTLAPRLTTTFSAVNVPANYTVSVEKRIAIDGFQLYSSGERNVGTPQNVNVPDIAGAEQIVIAKVSRPGTEDYPAGTQIYATRTPSDPNPAIVDVGAFSPTRYVSEAGFTPLGLTWTEDGAGLADVVVATLKVTPRVVGTGNEFYRAIVGPYTGPSLRLPTLPTLYATTYSPKRDDQITLSAGIAQITGGYNGLRAKLFTQLSILDAVAMAGSVTLAYTGPKAPAIEPPPKEP